MVPRNTWTSENFGLISNPQKHLWLMTRSLVFRWFRVLEAQFFFNSQSEDLKHCWDTNDEHESLHWTALKIMFNTLHFTVCISMVVRAYLLTLCAPRVTNINFLLTNIHTSSQEERLWDIDRYFTSWREMFWSSVKFSELVL